MESDLCIFFLPVQQNIMGKKKKKALAFRAFEVKKEFSSCDPCSHSNSDADQAQGKQVRAAPYCLHCTSVSAVELQYCTLQ